MYKVAFYRKRKRTGVLKTNYRTKATAEKKVSDVKRRYKSIGMKPPQVRIVKK